MLKLGAGAALGSGAWLSRRFVRGRRRAEADWKASLPAVLGGLGTVSELRILPLVDARAHDGLAAEAGVSYLVVADDVKILFDLGLSGGARGTLARNARELDIDLGSARVDTLVEAPLHAVVGGLHLPVHGLFPQDFIGGARWPWQHTTEGDVAEAIEALRMRDPQLVAISPHDSSQWTLDRFAEAFNDRYRTINVGEEIRITAQRRRSARSSAPATAGGRV